MCQTLFLHSEAFVDIQNFERITNFIALWLQVDQMQVPT
jgi:hypothetical protein